MRQARGDVRGWRSVRAATNHVEFKARVQSSILDSIVDRSTRSSAGRQHPRYSLKVASGQEERSRAHGFASHPARVVRVPLLRHPAQLRAKLRTHAPPEHVEPAHRLPCHVLLLFPRGARALSHWKDGMRSAIGRHGVHAPTLIALQAGLKRPPLILATRSPSSAFPAPPHR